MGGLEKDHWHHVRQMSASKGEREVIQDVCQAGNGVWHGNSGGNQETGKKNGSGRNEDAAVLNRKDYTGQNQKRESAQGARGGRNEKDTEGSEIAMVWACVEKR